MSVQAGDVEAIGELLEGVVGGGVRVDAVAALAGISHRSFRVATDRGAFVVKFREAGAADVLGVEAEFRVHERAAAAGVAPEAVGYDAGRGALVSRFVEGVETLTPARVREPAVIERIARVLDALHAVEVGSVAAFTAETHARAYIAAARRARELDAADGALADELLELAVEFDGAAAERVLCHSDLVASNVLEGRRLWLIDFEYAAAADPVLDLASLAAMNRFEPGQRRALLEAYGTLAARPWRAADFDKVVRLLALLAYFWADAEAGLTGSREGLEQFRRQGDLINHRNS